MLAPLANRDYRWLLAGFALGQMLMPLQFVTQILWVQNNAPDGIWLLLVALIGVSRGLGAFTFGLYGGALADRFDRRLLLIANQGLLVVTTVLIATLMYFDVTDWLGFATFFAITFVAGGLQSIDIPTRLAIVPDVLGPSLTPAGLTLNQVAAQMAMPLALLATGFIIDGLGYSGSYLLSALGHVATIFFLALMRYEQTTKRSDAPFSGLQAIRDVGDGFRYARSQPAVLWTILLLVTMMSFGFPATANLGPTWITTVVGVETRYFGVIGMTWGLGSLLAALVLMRLSSYPRRGLLVGIGATIFAVSFYIFVMGPTVWHAVIGNLGLGAGMTTASVSATILIQHLVANEVRGRVMSIFQLNMGFAQFMTMPVAIAAMWVPIQTLFPALALFTLAVVLAILFGKREVVRARVLET